jgi:hypothetical protein
MEAIATDRVSQSDLFVMRRAYFHAYIDYDSIFLARPI